MALFSIVSRIITTQNLGVNEKKGFYISWKSCKKRLWIRRCWGRQSHSQIKANLRSAQDPELQREESLVDNGNLQIIFSLKIMEVTANKQQQQKNNLYSQKLSKKAEVGISHINWCIWNAENAYGNRIGVCSYQTAVITLSYFCFFAFTDKAILCWY